MTGVFSYAEREHHRDQFLTVRKGTAKNHPFKKAHFGEIVLGRAKRAGLESQMIGNITNINSWEIHGLFMEIYV